MKSISASIVAFAGALILIQALKTNDDEVRFVATLVGGLVGTLGLVAWLRQLFTIE